MKIIFFALFVFCLAILVQGQDVSPSQKEGCIKQHREEMKALKQKTSEAFKACDKDESCQRGVILKAIKEAQAVLKDCLKGTGAE